MPTGANALPTSLAAAPAVTVSELLSWVASVTAHADSAYHFQVATLAGVIVYDDRIPGTSAEVPDLRPGTPYQWRIATGQDSEHYASPWSPWQKFTTAGPPACLPLRSAGCCSTLLALT
jgi:hypothetical protein